MQNLGDRRIDDYITFGVQLHRFSSGAVYAPTGDATYTFYENNSTSGAPTGGNLAQLNSKTGLYSARVQLTTAAGFEAGKDYFVHVEATVDGVAAGELFSFRVIDVPTVDVTKFGGSAGTFSGGRPEVNTTHLAGTAYASADLSATMKASVNTEADTALSDYGALKPTTAGRTLDVSAGGEAGLDWANIGSPTTTVGLSGTTVKTATDVEADTQDLQTQVGTAGAGLTNINLPDQAMNITGDITGNLSGSVGSVAGAVGSVTGAVGSVTGNVGGNVTGSVGSLATQAKADVNTEVLDVLNVDTFAEPGQGTPGATITLAAKINYLYKAWRVKKTQTATTKSFFNDDGATVDHKCTVADDGTTYSETEMTTGP